MPSLGQSATEATNAFSYHVISDGVANCQHLRCLVFPVRCGVPSTLARVKKTQDWSSFEIIFHKRWSSSLLLNHRPDCFLRTRATAKPAFVLPRQCHILPSLVVKGPLRMEYKTRACVRVCPSLLSRVDPSALGQATTKPATTGPLS